MEERLEKMEEDNSETSSEIASSWNSSHENLLSAIADRSNCYRWLHNKCQTHFDNYNFYLTIPSVAISTLAGSATIALQSLFHEGQREVAGTLIGLMTLGVGVLTSINQYMKTSQNAEAHRIAGIAHGKLHRVIASELTLRRDQRLNALDFLKVVRSEQDRLQETCPVILDCIVAKFNTKFKDSKDLEKPEIVGDLDHVVANRSIRIDMMAHTVSSTSSPLPKKYSMQQMPKNLSSQQLDKKNSSLQIFDKKLNNLLTVSNKTVPLMTKIDETPMDSHYFQLDQAVQEKEEKAK